MIEPPITLSFLLSACYKKCERVMALLVVTR